MPWANTPADRARSNATYGAAWRRARTATLRAARWRCQLRLDGCAGAASEVDHIDGAQNDPNHKRLRAACKRCHEQVTAAQGNDARRARGNDPPAQGRTAW